METRNSHNILVVKSQVRRKMHAIDMFYWQTFKDPAKVTGNCFLENCEGRRRCVKNTSVGRVRRNIDVHPVFCSENLV